MTKLLLVLVLFGMVANGLESLHSQPPLLIDSQPLPSPITSLDESR